LSATMREMSAEMMKVSFPGFFFSIRFWRD
jgi:hypothetical protein